MSLQTISKYCALAEIPFPKVGKASSAPQDYTACNHVSCLSTSTRHKNKTKIESTDNQLFTCKVGKAMLLSSGSWWSAEGKEQLHVPEVTQEKIHSRQFSKAALVELYRKEPATAPICIIGFGQITPYMNVTAEHKNYIRI